MDLCGGGYGQYSESRRSDPEWAVVRMTIGAGQILSSRPRDCSPWFQPGSQRANHDEETTDWRAVCGRTARTVRRAGTARAVPDPYQGRELDPRLRHSGVTSWESSFLDSYPQIFEGGGHKDGRIRIAKFYSSFVSFVRFVVICYLLV